MTRRGMSGVGPGPAASMLARRSSATRTAPRSGRCVPGAGFRAQAPGLILLQSRSSSSLVNTLFPRFAPGLEGRHDFGIKLFVGNLPFDTDEASLRQLFETTGKEVAVAIINDRMTGRPRGFAFVTMASDEDAQAACAALNGTALGERNLVVNEATPRAQPMEAAAEAGVARLTAATAVAAAVDTAAVAAADTAVAAAAVSAKPLPQGRRLAAQAPAEAHPVARPPASLDPAGGARSADPDHTSESASGGAVPNRPRTALPRSLPVRTLR